MKKKNGFTLIELLAVIVILAIIMIIAIPAVLQIMNNARKQSFALYIAKVVRDTQTLYTSDANLGSIPNAGMYVYDICSDLGYSTCGNYRGYVVVNATNVDNVQYSIFMHDNNYMIINHNITTGSMPSKDSASIKAYNNSDWTNNASTAVTACHSAAGSTTVTCYNRYNYQIVNS